MLPRMRAQGRECKARERELEQRRERVADRAPARPPSARARGREGRAEGRASPRQRPSAERAEAELPRAEAELHERGMADDELIEDHERERFAGTSRWTRDDGDARRPTRRRRPCARRRPAPTATPSGDRTRRRPGVASTSATPSAIAATRTGERDDAPAETPPRRASRTVLSTPSRSSSAAAPLGAQRRGDVEALGELAAQHASGGRAARCVSTPSAITSSPRLCASPTIALTISNAPASWPIADHERAVEILTASPGKRCSSRSDEAPVPKSSMCVRTPCSLEQRARARAARPSRVAA